jgi:hypothetical protein
LITELVRTRHDIDHHALEYIDTSGIRPVICTPGFDIKGLVGGRPLETVEGVLPLITGDRPYTGRTTVIKGLGTTSIISFVVVLGKRKI